eukprot:TRINITY_DN5494_c0_g3_i3.p1 TRINITY_DN5494_c0_g3~~TRINITY_DN5494_c0_g3_i3.p1  ORF type:complete len:201 (+),score=37.64 TRINITY_DN5494_c0_g3_i3:285-887(+)
MQMEAKSRQTRVERQEDISYADAVKKYVDIRAEEDKRREQEQHKAKMKYREILEQQIEEANKRHMYRDVMSIHEKKINKMDLTAYENMDTNLYSKVVGTRDIVPPLNPAAKPPMPSQNETSSLPECELIRKINVPGITFKRDCRYAQKTPDCNSSSRLLAIATHVPHVLCVDTTASHLSLIHICRCRRYAVCRSRWSPYH